MQVEEINIKLIVMPKTPLSTPLNRVIQCISQGHYQGETFNKSTLIKDKYNFFYQKKIVNYDNITIEDLKND